MKKYIKIITCILIFALMTFTLTACNDAKKVENTVDKLFVAFEKSDFEKAQEYLDIDTLLSQEKVFEQNQMEFVKKLFKSLKYEIMSSQITDEDTVIVKTKITAIDTKPILQEFFAEYLQYALTLDMVNQPTEDVINKKAEEILLKSLDKEDLDMVTNEVDIKVVKVDGKWKIELTNDISDALYGGMHTAGKDLEQIFNN